MKVFNSYQELAAGTVTLHSASSQTNAFSTEVSVPNAMNETGSGNPQELTNATLASQPVPSPFLQQPPPSVQHPELVS